MVLPLAWSALKCIRDNRIVRTFTTHNGRVLVLSTIYPQPNASAAGSRISFLLRQLCKNPWESVHFAATSTERDEDTIQSLTKCGVNFHTIIPNSTMDMRNLLDEIGEDLSMVIYDKFYSEEMFSFHIHTERPKAVHVIDMQDMHSLRRCRQQICEASAEHLEPLNLSQTYFPSHENDLLVRELVSLNRSDLTLVCSPIELDIIAKRYGIKPDKLCLASFWVDQTSQSIPDWTRRNHFCFVGGFRHDPNVDAVKILVNYIWPNIRKNLPLAELHIYGAHTNHLIQQLHNPKQGILIKGYTSELDETLCKYRVLLAPLRFGAGIKGKIVDAWRCGLPVVTTSIGSEGMEIDNHTWGGKIENTIDKFSEAAVQLFENSDEWDSAVEQGSNILRKRFSTSEWNSVQKSLDNAVEFREERRSEDINRSLFWHQTLRSTKYFSKWIEARNNVKLS
jgi:O-antigen biosynthesis protein